MSARGTVDVYVARREALAKAIDDPEAHLSREERERARRFVLDDDRACFALCRAAARRILGRYVGARAESLRLEPHPRPEGKPRLRAPEAAIDFSVSRSAERFAIAICHGARVGIDVEDARPMPRLGAIVRQCFSDEERALLARLPEPARGRAFFRGWTRKESIVKAAGAGLRTPLRSVPTLTDADWDRWTSKHHRSEALPGSWSTCDLPIEGNGIGAVTTEGEPRSLSLFDAALALVDWDSIGSAAQ